jgi:hypothetical protein
VGRVQTPSAPSPVADPADASALLCTLDRLRSALGFDAELEHWHQQALAADLSTRPGGWNLVYAACMFCARCREVADPEHEQRPLVDGLCRRLRSYGQGTEELQPLVHGTGEVVRRHATTTRRHWRDVAPDPTRLLRRERRRESRPQRRRTRIRSGSRGDPPSGGSEDDEPHDPARRAQRPAGARADDVAANRPEAA